MSDALLFAPEIALIATGLLLFFCSVFETSYRTAWLLALLGGALSLAAVFWTFGSTGEPFAPGIYRVDFFSQFAKMALALGYLLVVAISYSPQTLNKSAWLEFPMLLLFATLGTMMMVSATELLTLYIAMELAAYPLYIAVALHRNPESSGESSTKYMLQGMITSAISLYGMSFLYGVLARLILASLPANCPPPPASPCSGLAWYCCWPVFFLNSAPFPSTSGLPTPTKQLRTKSSLIWPPFPRSPP